MPDGGGQGNVLTSSLGFSANSDSTVELWVDLRGAEQNATNLVFSRYDMSQNRISLRWGQPRKLDLQLSVAGGAPARESNIGFPAEGLHHIGIVYAASDRTTTLCLDGSIAAEVSVSDPSWTPSAQTIAFGSAWFGGGVIDEIRVSEVARPQIYMQAIATSYQPGFFQADAVELRDAF